MPKSIILKDYIIQVRGVSYKPEDSSLVPKNDYIPILRANNIKNGKINYDELVYVKKSKIKESQILKKGDILICTSSGSKELVGKSAMFQDDILCSFGAFCKVIRANNINNLYLNNYFQSPKYKKDIKRSSTGANINNLKDSDFDNLTINLVSENEQKDVSNELNKIIELIDLKNNLKDKLKKLIFAQYNYMFNNIYDNQKNFERKKIADLVEKNVSKLRSIYSEGQIINYVDISSIDREKNIVKGTTKYKVGEEPSRAQQCLEVNDILMATVRPNLKNIAVLTKKYDNPIGTSGFCVLRCRNCKKNWLLYSILTNEFTNSMNKKTIGASYPAIKNSDILDFEIPVPPIELQNKFENFVEDVNSISKQLDNSIQKMENLLEIRMNNYFN